MVRMNNKWQIICGDRTKWWLLVAMCFFLFLPSLAVHAETEQPVYTIGVVPQFDVRRIHAIWMPIVEALQRRTGLKFTLRGAATIPEFEREFMAGNFDFVYMNPYHILLANKQQGYLPLVRDVGRKLHGIVVVRTDSPYRSLADLAGKRMAFPSPNALGASLMIRAALLNIYKINIKPSYVKTHTSVYLNVALGEVEGGGGVQKTLEQQRPEIRQALRVLYETEQVEPHPLSVHPRVPAMVMQRVKEAFLEMGKSPEGREILARIPMKTIGPAKMADYVPVGRLGLDAFFEGSD